MKKILLLSSNHRNDLKLSQEIKEIKEVIKRAQKNSPQKDSQFEVEIELEVQTDKLQELFIEQEPRIVHFCGHGRGKQGLVLQNQAGDTQLLTTEALSNLFGFFGDKVECVLLNACYSEVQANSIVQHINYAIGMSHDIRDDAAIAFAAGFYRWLSLGNSIEEAYKFGRNAIELIITDSNNSRFRSEQDKRNAKLANGTQLASVAEHLKPVIKKKSPLTVFSDLSKEVTSASSNDKPDLATPSNLTPEQLEIERLKQEIAQEVRYKGYRDRARDTWDDFGQTPVTPQNLTQNEYRQRKTLLNKVKDFWIEGFLKPSLYGNNAINLDWKNNSNAVLRPSEAVEDLPVELYESFEELQTTDILSQTGQGKTLLILGEPGSGKTIALLQLAKKLIQQTEQDLTKPIPVVFNLSSWGQKQQAIKKWLIEELKDKYQVPQTWSEPWIEQQQLILLFDGLDEVQEGKRDACVRALNKFIAAHNITEMVVCSRVKDYQALTERLQLSSAICIKPLSSEKLYEFLNKAGASLAGLKTLLQQDKELEQFAQTPLILNIMSVAYRDWSIKDLLREFLSSEDRYSHLFDSYIERMLRRRVSGKKEQKKNSPQYSQEKVLHWLSWLAKTMVEESKIIFLIEKLQPTLLESRSQRISYRISNFLLGGLIIGLSYGSSNGLFFGLIGGVIANLSKEIILFEQMSWSWQRAKSKIIRDFSFGLMGGLIFGLIIGLMGGLTEGLNEVLIIGLNEGLNEVLIIGLYGLMGGLIFGLMGGLIGGLIGRLNRGLSSTEVKQRTVPNQGIWSSRKNSVKMVLIYGLMGGLIFGLIFGLIYGLMGGLILGLNYGLIFGLFGGVLNGGATCIQHFNLRQILYRKGCIPWNYACFLDYASERLLMKKVGGGYIFYHRMLMEHFAQRHQISRKPIPVTPRQTSQPVTQPTTRERVSSRNARVSQPSNPVSNHIVCSNCSHQNATTGKFCTKCGTQISVIN
jgi:hypothetical protein